jgi:hypothetical protein
MRWSVPIGTSCERTLRSQVLRQRGSEGLYRTTKESGWVPPELRAGSPRSGSPIRIAQKPEKNRHLPERFSVRPPIRVRARHKRLGETKRAVGWLEMVDCFLVPYINRKLRS